MDNYLELAMFALNKDEVIGGSPHF